MARIRTVKPEFWTDEKTGQLSAQAKCLFIGFLNLSDDYGIVEYRPAEWRAKIFPYDSHTTPVVLQELLVNEILPMGLVVMFSISEDESDTKKFLFISNFDKHQVVNKPSKPTLPGWKRGDTPKSYGSRLGHAYSEIGALLLPEHSGSPPTPLLPGKERKGKEEEVKGKTRPNSSAATPPRADIDRATDAWNETASKLGLARITKLTDARRRQLGARLRSDGFEAWQAVLVKIEASSFLRGTNDRSWRVDFDFAISERGFTKIQEGKYNSGPPQRAAPDETTFAYLRDQYGEHLASIADTWAKADAILAAEKAAEDKAKH